jgi:transcriptional regulator with XRE-family HTH domain
MLEKKLKALLKSKNMSVTELSKATGVPKTNLNSWLVGSSPNIQQVDKVASYFGITVDELVFDRKPKTSIDELFTEALIHSGHYKISITKLVKKDDSED